MLMFYTGTSCVSAEKVALMSPDDEVQKSDVSSSSQGMVEKEALGPLLLEVCNIKGFFNLIIILAVSDLF